MSTDYDLVILGGGLEGRIAAMTAVEYGARVALVEPLGLFDDGVRQRSLLLGLQQLGQVQQRQAVGEWFGYGKSTGGLDWPALIAWSRIAAESESAQLSVAMMSASGIDVVLERPERLSRRMMVTTAHRRLSARGVLAAYGRVPFAMPLLEAVALPGTVDVVGGSVLAIAWAEALAAVGIKVRLIATRVLPGADEDVRRLVRSQLIATGIEITPTASDDNFTLNVEPGEPTLTLPNFASDPLTQSSYLSVNRKLQTAHPRLFACGAAIAGSTNLRLAEYEARIAVKNALFLPNKSTDYRSVVQGHDRYACVGLTEAEAMRRYGVAVQVQTASDAGSVDLSRVDPMLEYCKLVWVGDSPGERLRQRLIGVHLLGDGAEAIACLLSKWMGKPIADLDDGSLSGSGLGQLVFECVGRSQGHSLGVSRQSQWQTGRWRRDWAENWFNWRRSR